MQRFDQLFSLYHSFPLQNNPHIHPNSPPGSIPRDPDFFRGPEIRLNTRRFDGNDLPGLYTIDEYFDFYATPLRERLRLLGLCMQSQASKWFRWMWTDRLLSEIPPPMVFDPSSVPPPPWIELPGDVTANILQRLGPEVLLTSAQQVCTTWWMVSKDPSLWRIIDFSNPMQGVLNDYYNIMCCRAVDRSQGQLVDLTIQYFGDEALIDYIVYR